VDQFDLKKTANDASSPTPRLRLWLMALSHVVSRLDKQHSTLVQGIVDLPWTTMESNFVQTYINFIGILVSARPEYLTLVLGKITHGFTYRMYHYAPNMLAIIDHMLRIRSSSS
jgi:RNA polymerase I-specific transcription initiation factor RRN3